MERLDADAELCDAGVFAGTKNGRSHIIRMQFDADTLGDDEMFADSTDNLGKAVCNQCRCSAAKVQTGRTFLTVMTTTHQMNLLNQGVNIAVTQVLIIRNLTVRAEVTDTPAKWDMDVKS